MEAYKELEAYEQKQYHLTHLLSLAGWDLQVMMPPKGAKARSAAMAELQQLMHDMTVNDHVKGLLEKATAAKDSLSPVDQANLREMQRNYNNEAALPADFVQRKMRMTAEALPLWAQSRAENDFQLFLPTFKAIIELTREEARYRSAASGNGLYESLFHMYEPGMSLATVERIFTDVKSWLPKLLKEVRETRKSIDETIVPLQPPFPVEKQEAMVRHFMKVWGFDFEGGRLDVAAHPFTGMVKEDSRITTHYSTEDYAKACLATIHETGHSKYETNCGPIEKRGQRVCSAISLSIHESQSRFAEVVIGRSAAFAEFMTPCLKEYLGDQPAFTVENVRKINQKVNPGYIRILADELCYPLHILLRYEMERDLVEGKLEAEDVPRVWNEKMKEYLGLETEGKDNLGCLQDVHWSQCYIGYFPTYSLGSMFAAQLMATIKKEIGADTVDKAIRSGQLEPIFAKQKEKIWSKGSLYETEELIEKATGEPLNPKYFREYLERRYLRNED